ncbi:hypothetical protein B566_EDAN002498, partial [Ephemera danica]
MNDIKEKKIDFDGARSSLHRIIKSMGFFYDKINVKTIMMEKPYIVSWRHRFLRTFMTNKMSPMPRTVIWLDETWITLYGSSAFCWQDGTPEGLPNWRPCDGRRFIVLHAGTSEGWIPGASLLFASKSSNTDYHGDMNGDNFLRWCLKQFLPYLPPNCLIIMDNAPYHTVEHRNIQFDQTLTKPDLLKLVNYYQDDRKRFVVDEIFKDHGHDVLRLPPYHFHFNAIE